MRDDENGCRVLIHELPPNESQIPSFSSSFPTCNDGHKDRRSATRSAYHNEAWASGVLGSHDLADRRFDDGDVLLRRSAAHSDAGDHLALAGERDAAAHRGVSAAGDREEGIQLRAWLHERNEVSGAHADESGRVGLSLGELEREHGRSGHTVGENDVAVNVDDGNRDGYVFFERLGLDAVSDVLRDRE
jgi:hypothetical protein